MMRYNLIRRHKSVTRADDLCRDMLLQILRIWARLNSASLRRIPLVETREGKQSTSPSRSCSAIENGQVLDVGSGPPTLSAAILPTNQLHSTYAAEIQNNETEKRQSSSNFVEVLEVRLRANFTTLLSQKISLRSK